MKFKNDIEVQAGIKDSSGSDGTLGQVLSSTVSGVSWITPPVGVTGSGTTNFLPKWNSSTGLTDSIIFNNGNGVTIGATSSSPNSGWRLNIHPASTQAGLGIFCYNNNSLHGLRIEMTGTGDFIQARDVATQNDVFSVSYLGNTTANSFIKIGGTSSQYLMADGSVSTGPSVSGFVPYTGANQNVDLGIYTLLAAKGVFSSSGSDNTVEIGHSSGSGIALNIIKGGNGEGLYINKTSGSGNAATIIGTLNATTLVKSGGTADQYLKADGSVSTAMNSRVEVNFTATAGQTTFTTTYDVGQIDVFYNGSKLNPSEFTATNGTTVVLAQPATLNAQISIVKYIGSINGVSGTANRVAKFTGITTLGDSQIDDNGTNVSIGYTTNPNTHKLDVNGTGRFSGTGLNASVRITNTTASTGKDWNLYSLNNGNFGLYNNTDGLYSLISTPSGNVGIGVTPSAWSATLKALQINTAVFSGQPGAEAMRLGSNWYFDGGMKYQGSGFATIYGQDGGGHYWSTAPSGTAGNAISFTQAMTLDASGRLGIGTGSDIPEGKLTVQGISAQPPISGTTANSLLQLKGSLNNELNIGSNTVAGGYGSYIQASDNNLAASYQLNLQPNGGNVIIGGYTDAGYKLDVNGTGRFGDVLTVNANSGGGGINIIGRALDGFGFLTFKNNANNTINGEIGVSDAKNMLFYIGSSERMRITSGGFIKASNDGSYYNISSANNEFTTNQAGNYASIFVNKNNSSPFGLFIYYSTVAPNNTSNRFIDCEDTGGLRMQVRSNGGIANYQGNNVNLSDERTKKDIIPLDSYWDKFKAIEIVKFKYIDQTHDDFNIGVIAQQVEKIAPEFIDVDGWNVKVDEEGNEIISEEEPLKSVYTADLYHATIKVLQEAMAKIEELTARLEILENK
jgi:hypothetical protein